MISADVKAALKDDKLMAVVKDLQELTKIQVLVGVPEVTAGRSDDGPSNAFLAYIHDNGSPKQNIPARPFMKPGIAYAQNSINRYMLAAARAQMNNDPEAVESNLMMAGMRGQSGIRHMITEGDFEPLKPATLRGRMRRRKFFKDMSAAKRKEVWPEIMASFKPLIDTGSLRQSISMVIRKLT